MGEVATRVWISVTGSGRRPVTTSRHQKPTSVRNVRGTSRSDTLLSPPSRGRCVTGTSVTA